MPARREFKYLLPPERLPELRAALKGLCRRDPHAGADGTYRIRTLYLDTPRLDLFRANDREAPVRFKARLRGYPDDPSAPVLAEIKGRHVDVIRKTRAALPGHGWPETLRPGAASAAVAPEQRPAYDAFVYRLHRHGLEPKCLVQYRREAWVSELDDYARVSVDTEVVCQLQTEWRLDGSNRWRALDHPLRTFTPGSPTVLELKWAERAPAWMLQLVQRMDLIRHAFSKYGYSMLELAEDHFRGYRRPVGAA